LIYILVKFQFIKYILESFNVYFHILIVESVEVEAIKRLFGLVLSAINATDSMFPLCPFKIQAVTHYKLHN